MFTDCKIVSTIRNAGVSKKCSQVLGSRTLATQPERRFAVIRTTREDTYASILIVSDIFSKNLGSFYTTTPCGLRCDLTLNIMWITWILCLSYKV